MLLIRATLAFLALPAMVAGLVPTLLMRHRAPDPRTFSIGVAVLIVGSLLLLWCVRDFLVTGKGTLAPWDPPKHLVFVGLYRFMRNPMYLAVLTIVAGWSLLYLSAGMAVYLIFLAATFHVRAVRYEEPWLHRQFGAEWEVYAASTARWLPHWPKKKP